MKQGQPKVPTINKFLSELATTHYTEHKKPLKVGIDAFVHSATFAKDLNEAFVNAAKDVDVGDDAVATNGDAGMEAEVPVIAELDTLDGKPNIVDSIWEGRPDLPKNPFRVQVCSPFLFHYIIVTLLNDDLLSIGSFNDISTSATYQHNSQ